MASKTKTSDKTQKDNSARSALWAIKIHVPYDNPLFYPQHAELSTLFSTYALIRHDCDLENSEDVGSVNAIAKVSRPHFHIVARSYSRTYFNPIKKKIMQLFSLSENVVTVDKVLSLTGSLRYLIHLDNPEKHQYDINKIITNNTSWLYSNMKISEESYTEYLIQAMDESNGDYRELLRILGLNVCKKYHSVIYMYYRTYFRDGIHLKEREYEN